MRRRSIGARLSASAALLVAIAIAVFAVAGALVLWRHELTEQRTGTIQPASAVVGDFIVILGFIAPVVIGLTALATRRTARGLTARVDAVIASATGMSHRDLSRRLPVSAVADEIDAMAAALNGLLERVERGFVAQTRFVADASHELRTPLAVLRTELEVARLKPRAASEWEALADRVLGEVGRMTEMVEALLRLARADTAGVADAPIDGGALVLEVAERWRPLAQAAGVEIVARATDDAAVSGDEEALAVVLDNLVKNAIAHSPRGGRIEVLAARAGDLVELVVDDEGPGVPGEDRQRIFLPFARGSGAADRAASDGVGLGLSVALRIVIAHRGTIAVERAPRGGARFVVRLPRREDPSSWERAGPARA